MWQTVYQTDYSKRNSPQVVDILERDFYDTEVVLDKHMHMTRHVHHINNHHQHSS